MINPQPSQTFRGSVEEVFSHRDEIPPGAVLELKVFAPQPEEEEVEFGGKSVYEVFQDVIGTLDFEPTDLGRRAEDYLAGFGETTNRRKITP
jgi:hypothetical protein